jgi:uncharacterized protein (UPF0332 family)
MKEIVALIGKAERFVKSARMLIDEADYESSVSRAYYAMFFMAEAVLLTKNLSFSSHKGVISGFGEHFIKSGILRKELGKELSLAFQKRQIGDYEINSDISAEDAREVLSKANEFVAALKSYLDNADIH